MTDLSPEITLSRSEYEAIHNRIKIQAAAITTLLSDNRKLRGQNKRLERYVSARLHDTGMVPVERANLIDRIEAQRVELRRLSDALAAR